MAKALIFDMDGVIIESEGLHLKSFNKVLEKFNLSFNMHDFKNKFIGLKDIDVCGIIIKDFNLPISREELLNQKRKYYLEILKKEKISPTKGVVEIILEAHKKIPLGIASNSNKDEINLVIEKFKINDYFKAIVTSNDVKLGKPAPDIYLEVSRLLKANPKDCIVIEDTPVGIKSAKAAGMFCIAITTTHSKNELKEADTILDNFEEISTLF